MKALNMISFLPLLIKAFDIASFVQELGVYYNKTATIQAFVCNKQEAKSLFAQFSREFVQIGVSNYQNHLPSKLFVLNLDCPNFQQKLLEASSSRLFSSSRWIIYYNKTASQEFLEKYFNNIEILIDSDIILVYRSEIFLFNIVSIYKSSPKLSVVTEKLGEWNNREKTIKFNKTEKIISRRRRNLMGTVLKTCMVVTNNDTFNHLTDKRDRHIDSIVKVNYILIEHLKDIINASLKYSVEVTWGYKDNDSKWNGMIGELTRNEAEIGGTPLFVTNDRIEVIDYIAMTTPTKSKFIFRQPKLSYVANVFTMPFDRFVWASVLGLMLTTALILYIVVKWEWKKKDFIEEVETNEREMQVSWTESIFVSFGALCQQGTTSVPFSFPGRITVIFLFVSYMFLYTSYSANIVALLQSSSRSIKTLNDILHSRLDVGVDDTVFNHFYFPTATEPIRRALYLQKVAPKGQKPRFYEISEGVKKIRAGLFAFHVETGPGYKLVSETFREDEKCGLQEVAFLQVPDPWLAIKKNSCYKKILKVGLHQLQENGLQAREVGLIYTKKPQCLSRGNSFISVGMVDCYAAAVVFLGGSAAALVILLVEIYIKNRIDFYTKRTKRLRKKRLDEEKVVID